MKNLITICSVTFIVIVNKDKQADRQMNTPILLTVFIYHLSASTVYLNMENISFNAYVLLFP